MPSVAEQLRQAREQQELTVYQVAESTKIKTDHVRALESGNYDAFAAPVYIRGFVRAYAALLHLDVPRVMGDLEAELARTENFRDPPSLTNRRRGLLDWLSLLVSKLNWRFVAPAAGVVLLVLAGAWALRAWQRHQAADPLANLGPGLYQPKTAPAADTLPVPQIAPASTSASPASAPAPASPGPRR